MRRFENKVALVTGAARGQGRCHAVRLAAEGAAVIAIDICENVESIHYELASEADLAEVAAAVEAEGGRILTAKADVRDREALDRVVTEGVERFGGLDAVIANAGISSFAPSGNTVGLSDDAWKDMIDINLTGAWNTCKATIPALVERGGGAIVITSSILGLRGFAGIPHYSAAKHGLTGMMRTLAIDYGPQRVRVNCVNPTNVLTPILDNPEAHALFRPDLDQPTLDDMASAALEMHLLPEPWVESADVVEAALFLASEQGRFITGVNLPVDLGAVTK